MACATAIPLGTTPAATPTAPVTAMHRGFTAPAPASTIMGFPSRTPTGRRSRDPGTRGGTAAIAIDRQDRTDATRRPALALPVGGPPSSTDGGSHQEPAATDRILARA